MRWHYRDIKGGHISVHVFGYPPLSCSAKIAKSGQPGSQAIRLPSTVSLPSGGLTKHERGERLCKLDWIISFQDGPSRFTHAWSVEIDQTMKMLHTRVFLSTFFLRLFPFSRFFQSSWDSLQGAFLDTKCRPLDFFHRFEFTLLPLFVFGFHSRFLFSSPNGRREKVSHSKF